MPPFFNRLQGLLPQQQYPYPTPTYPNMGVIQPNFGLNSLSDGDTSYIGQDVGSVNDRLSQLGQQSQSPLMDQYLQYLQQYPKPTDYKPSKLDRLSAALSGVAAGWRNPSEGVGIARNILERPYEKALELYKLRGGGLQAGANIEEHQQAAQERARTQEEAIQQRREASEATEHARKAETERKSERDKVWSEWTKHRGAIFDWTSSKWLYPDGRVVEPDEPIDPSKLGESERIEINQRNALERIKAGGIEQRKTEIEAKQPGREALEKLRAEGKTRGIDLPTQQRTDIFNKAQQTKNAHPEWANWIEANPNGEVIIHQPGWLSGPSKEVFDQIYNEIYGKPQAKPKTPQVDQSKKGKVHVMDKNGQTGWIPEEQLEEAITKHGYTRIK